MKRTLAFGLVALVGCRQPPVVEPATSTAAEISASEPARSRPLVHEDRWPGGCETLVDVESPDTLRLVSADGLVLYANEQVGLAIVDVSNPDEPRILGLSEMRGQPIGVFETRGAAIVVYQPWDRPPETIVRAVSLEPRSAGQPLGEVKLAGLPRDARRVGDFVVVTRETPAGKT